MNLLYEIRSRWSTSLALGILLIDLLLLFGCSSQPEIILPQVVRMQPSDPFRSTMTKSQFFELKPGQENIIEGERGTTIQFPKGCFVDGDGETWDGPVKLELTEVLELDEMLLSNLTTTANGELLVTDGMLYVNATSLEGLQLAIDPTKPMYIQVPTEKRKPGMMAYVGQRDSAGNMTWADPVEIKSYLINVDLDLLDFYPINYEALVESNMPFRGHEVATGELKDSLFYSLSLSDGGHLVGGRMNTSLNEAYENMGAKVVEGSYTDSSFIAVDEKGDTAYYFGVADTTRAACGIDPARIKPIRTKAFENTLIATREFETRLQWIYKSCNNDILETYVNGVDKNLWELDSIAWTLATDPEVKARFNEFYLQKLTNVKDAPESARGLTDYYNKILRKTQNELDALLSKANKELDKQNQSAEQLAAAYREVLWKREKYRMENYGFTWSRMGWINIDTAIRPKVYIRKPFEVKVTNGKEMDRAYTYLLFSSMKSLYRMNSSDREVFHAGNPVVRELNMPKDGFYDVVGIGYVNEQAFFSQTIVAASEKETELTLEAIDPADLKKTLRSLKGKGAANDIRKDLAYQAKLFAEQQRQQKLREEAQFIMSLWFTANPCCDEGRRLFEANCRTCHKPDSKFTGPSLRGVSSMRPKDWLVAKVRNSTALIESGDPIAVQLYEQYNGTPMNTFDFLTEAQIKAIFDYVDRYNNDPEGFGKRE